MKLSPLSFVSEMATLAYLMLTLRGIPKMPWILSVRRGGGGGKLAFPMSAKHEAVGTTNPPSTSHK